MTNSHKKPRVLVTGACGYIGSVLCRELCYRNYVVLGVDCFMHNNEQALTSLLGHPNFDFDPIDVRDTATLQGYVRQSDYVVPLAALVGAPLCERAPVLADQVNRQQVKDILDVIQPGQRVIYPNTNSGYGQTDGDHYCTEDEPLRPISVYGKTKVEAEKYVLDSEFGVSLRLATVFGPSPRMRFDLLVNDFTARLCKANRLTVYEPHSWRNYVHIRDVVRCIIYLLQNHKPTGAFNLGHPAANLTKQDLAHRICDTLGLCRSVVSVGEGTDPDRRNYLVSNDKILAAGFSFGHPLEEGIKDVAMLACLFTPPAIQRMRNA